MWNVIEWYIALFLFEITFHVSSLSALDISILYSPCRFSLMYLVFQQQTFLRAPLCFSFIFTSQNFLLFVPCIYTFHIHRSCGKCYTRYLRFHTNQIIIIITALTSVFFAAYVTICSPTWAPTERGRAEELPQFIHLWLICSMLWPISELSSLCRHSWPTELKRCICDGTLRKHRNYTTLYKLYFLICLTYSKINRRAANNQCRAEIRTSLHSPHGVPESVDPCSRLPEKPAIHPVGEFNVENNRLGQPCWP